MKQTKKEIEETVKNKIHRQYKDKMENYQARIDRLAKELETESRRRIEAQSKVEELEEKVRQYEDWNNRLQEYMDMDEKDRKNYLAELEVSAQMNNIFNVYSRFLGFIG